MRSEFIILFVCLAVLATIGSTKTNSPAVNNQKCRDNYYKNANGTCVFCPSGWKLLHGKCLTAIKTNGSWNEASQMCQESQYGELLKIDEPNFTHYLSQVSKLFGFSENTLFFIGLRSKGSFTRDKWSFGLPQKEWHRKVTTDGPEWYGGNYVSAYANVLPTRSPNSDCAMVVRTLFEAIQCDKPYNLPLYYVCQKMNSPTYALEASNHVGKACQTEFQCSFNEFCKDYYCACSFGYTRVNGKCQRCPTGWIRSGDSCYQLSEGHSTHQNASQSCIDKNSRLAEIDSSATSDYPIQLMTIVESLDLDKAIWINGVKPLNSTQKVTYHSTHNGTSPIDLNITPWSDYGLMGSVNSYFDTRRQAIASNACKCLTVDSLTNMIVPEDCTQEKHYLCERTLDEIATDVKITDQVKVCAPTI
jgi:hypothetical protein